MPTASELLLEPAEVEDDRLFRAPPREALVTPLVDGVAALRALEGEIARARDFVHLALWVFDPDTPVQSDAVRRLGVRSWGGLLAAAAAGKLLPRRERPGKVSVRILVSDFDPVLQNDLHRNAWATHRKLVAAGDTIEGLARSRFEVVVGRPGAAVYDGAEGRAAAALRRIVRQLNAIRIWQGVDEALRRFADMPGLWTIVTFDAASGRFAVAEGVHHAVETGMHHEKLCVVDGRVGFCGGVDVHLGAVDTTAHGRGAAHAVHVELEGPVVADVDRAFRSRWNDEAPLHAAYIAAANEARGQSALAQRPAAAVGAAPEPGAEPAGAVPVQLHRTRAASIVPGVTAPVERRDVEEAYARAIGLAERFVYLEQRYLRAGPLVDALVARRAEVPGLAAIVVLPVVPDEVATDGSSDAVRHGLALQHDALATLRGAFGDQLGLYSLLARRSTAAGGPTVFRHSPQVPLHGTLLLVDDVYASVGSAHATARSFRLDGEVAVAWVDGASVRALRERLWKELLGSPPRLARWEPAGYVGEWNAIADANAGKAPGNRRGLVVRHDPENRPGARVDGLADELAELVDTEPGAVPDYLPDIRPDEGAATAIGQPPLTPLERDVVTRGIPLATDYAEVAAVLFELREHREPATGDAADAQTLSELRALIAPEIAAYEELAGKEFRSLNAFVRASFGEAKSGESKAQAVANYLMCRPLYVRCGYAHPVESIFSKIRRPSEGAKLLEHDVVGGVHEELATKLGALRGLLDSWGFGITDRVNDAIKGVGGFVPVVPQPDGTFRPRFVAGQSRPVLSNHASGLAIDVDATWNPQIPAGSKTIRLLKQITAKVAAADPSRGLPSDGYDFGRQLIDPSLGQWPDIGEATLLYLVSQQASDALREWLQGRLAREAELTAAADAALEAQKQAEAEKKAADATTDAARKAAAKDALKAARDARKAAKAAIDDDPDLQLLRDLRTAQGGGQGGKATVARWAEHGILNLPLALVVGFKLVEQIRWGMEYKSSKDAMHFETEPVPIRPDAPVLTGPRDLLPRAR